jgi:hypothetical protein
MEYFRVRQTRKAKPVELHRDGKAAVAGEGLDHFGGKVGYDPARNREVPERMPVESPDPRIAINIPCFPRRSASRSANFPERLTH